MENSEKKIQAYLQFENVCTGNSSFWYLALVFNRKLTILIKMYIIDTCSLGGEISIVK